jgi:hypothetical protein
MKPSTLDLETEVLNLPAEARVRLLEKLMLSLEPPTPAKKEWLDLAAKRRQEVLTGKVKMISSEGIVSDIKAKYL